MWVFTKQGFFSVVQDREHRSNVHVRARSEADLLEVWRHAQMLQAHPEIVYNDDQADYPFRVIMWKTTWAQILEMYAESIDYDKFKPNFEHEPEKHEILLKVWGDMLDWK